MSWFVKKEGDRNEFSESDIPELPRLPELPSLPDFSIEKTNKESLQQLPSYPPNRTGSVFSQNAIKDAVEGEEEDGTLEEFKGFDNTISKVPKKSKMKEMEEVKGFSRKATYSVPEEFREAQKKAKENEPIFIRLDKFEESLNIFQKTKDKINEMEKMLRDIRKIKEEEEKELGLWEEEIKTIKAQIEKIDNDLFSKIE